MLAYGIVALTNANKKLTNVNIVTGGNNMAIKYYKLFDLLTRRGMKKTDLIKVAGISSPTLAKLTKGETVQTDIIERICSALDCQPGDIMEFIPTQENPGD